jgi:putative ABC transport system permease protein
VRISLVFSAALRESRGARGRLVFFVLCLALGVAAVTGVSALVASIESVLRSQSQELLGADISVDARRPIPESIDGYFDFGEKSERVDVRELATLVAAGGKTRLVELKAIEGAFPFYGSIVLEPPGALGTLLTDATCAVATDMLVECDLKVGDSLKLGGAQFEIVAAVLDEPGRLDMAFTLGPRVFVSLDGLARTKLEGFGSRTRYKALYRLPRDPGERVLRAARERLDAEVEDAPYFRVESHRDAQPALRRSLERFESFLGLVALLSLVLGGTGVAQIVRAWIAARTQGVAVLRAIGFRPREVLAMYLGHVALLALVGSVIGATAGSLLPFLVPIVAPELVPEGHQILWEVTPFAKGIALGLGIALVFSVPPLIAIWRIAPVRVLRSDVEPLPAPRIVTVAAALVLAGGVFAAAFAQARDPLYAVSFTGGLAVLAGLLVLAARWLVWCASRLPREGLNPYLRHGVAALARPGIGVTGATVALGLGVLVVSSMVLIDTRLAERLRTALPPDAPSVFLLDVQPNQWDGVAEKLRGMGAPEPRSVPVLTARMSAIDGVDVKELSQKRPDDSGVGRRRWVLTREQRITWMRELTPDNKLVAGELWSDPERLEVSLEEKFAEDLGVGLGSRIEFDVQGRKIELAVTSLRKVEWESFGINFFLVAEPGALDDAPHFRLAAARLEPEAELQLQSSLADDFPNVTPIRVRPILDKILNVVSKLALGVRVLGLFTILTGLVILGGVASSTALQRSREVALLKTLGLTRLGVMRLFFVEYALVGLVAGLIGSVAGFVLSALFLERVVDTAPQLPWLALPLAALAVALLSAACGLAASTRALRSRPIESLRS